MLFNVYKIMICIDIYSVSVSYFVDTDLFEILIIIIVF